MRELKPDILLLDLAMPGVPGLEALRQLDEIESPVRTILLTAAIEKEEIVKALQLGARGVVMKESAIELLFQSIRCVSARGVLGRAGAGVGPREDAARQLPRADRRPESGKKTLRPDTAGAGDHRHHRGRLLEQGDRAEVLDQRGHRQAPPLEHLRQDGRFLPPRAGACSP